MTQNLQRPVAPGASDLAPRTGDPALSLQLQDPASFISDTVRPADGPELAAVAESAGLERIGMLAWRDLEDADAGGSELHCHEIARRWAAAGIEVITRTRAVKGSPREVVRDGYRAVRSGGRFSVFARAPLGIVSGRLGGPGELDGLVEIWNGMPFLSPLWFRGPRVTFLHHVHGEVWRMHLSPGLARVGERIELKLAPPVYRKTRVVSLSSSAREEIIRTLGLRPELVSVVPPGVDTAFSPTTSPAMDGAQLPNVGRPLILAVGRLVPVKRFDRLIRAAKVLATRIPSFEVVIVGEGYDRPALEAAIAASNTNNIVRLAGYVAHEDLISLYRQARVVVSTSAHEGWGMTVTEAGACGTPSVVTRIPGHVDAISDGVSGLLFDTDDELVDLLERVIKDELLRRRLSAGALARASALSWDATAYRTLELLADEAVRIPG